MRIRSARGWRWPRPALRQVVAALGLLCLLAAPVLRFVVTPWLAQAPLLPGPDGFVTQVSTGRVNAVLDLNSGQVTDPSAITQTATTRGDAAAALAARAQGHNVAVNATLTRTLDATGAILREENFRLAADRRSQALVDCCGVFVGGVAVATSGAGNPLRFPAFPSQATYPYFDTVLLTAAPMKFLGTAQLGGFASYKFQQATAPTAVGRVAVPGKLVGSKQATATGERMYAITRTVWVDPVTGIILRKTERIRETLRNSQGVDVLTLYSADLDNSAQQTIANIAAARSAGRGLRVTHGWAPLALLVSGALMIALTAFSAFRGQRSAELAREFTDEWADFDDIRGVR